MVDLIIDVFLKEIDGARELVIETSPNLGDAMGRAIKRDVKDAPCAHVRLLSARLDVRYRIIVQRDAVHTLIPGERRETKVDATFFTFLVKATSARLKHLHGAVTEIRQRVAAASLRSINTIIASGDLAALLDRTIIVRYEHVCKTTSVRDHNPRELIVDIRRPYVAEDDPFHPDGTQIITGIANAMLKDVEAEQIRAHAREYERKGSTCRDAQDLLAIP